jgi:hypothetical protein
MVEVVVEDRIAPDVGDDAGIHPEADENPPDGIARLAPGHHDSRQGERQETKQNLPPIANVAGRPGEGHVQDTQRERQRAQDDR